MEGVRRTRFAAALAAVLAALALGACGTTVTVARHRTLRVALMEYRLRPQRVLASAGSLTLVAHNYGRLTHNLAIFSGSEEIWSTPPIPPRQSVTLAVTLAPGTYRLASTILSDEALGTYGTLQVVAHGG